MWKRLGESNEAYQQRRRDIQTRYRRTKKNRSYRAAYAQRYLVKGKIQKSSQRYRNRLKIEKREILVEYKSTTPCVDCGKMYAHYVMDLDHVRGEKVMNVSLMVSRGFSVQAFVEEIGKCDCVCSNCHRVRTFTRAEHLMHERYKT